MQKSIWWYLLSIVFLFSTNCKSQSNSLSDFYDNQIPKVISLLCRNVFSPDSFRVLFKTDSTINDTTRNLSIWNLWYCDPTINKSRPYWELHVNQTADSVMVVVIPPKEITLPALKKKLHRWAIAGLPALKDYHSNYRHIVSANKPIVATLVYGNRIASIVIVYPAIKSM